MKLGTKIGAALAGVALAVTGVVGGTAAHASNATLITSSNRCVQWVPDGWPLGSYLSHCGAGYYTTNVSYVRIPPNTCRDIGYWAFTTYCAGSKARYIGVSGTNYIR